MVSRMFNLEDFFRSLEDWGLIDVLLPFLLIFTIIFAVLEKTKILGEEKRNLSTILALVISLIVVVPHVTGNYPAGYDPVKIINAALPSISILVVAIIMLLIMIGLFAHDRVYLGLTMPGWIAFISIIAIIAIFGSAAGWYASGFNTWLESWLGGSDALAVVIMILVFGVIIAFVTGGGKHKEEFGAFKRVGLNLGELFGKEKK